ncbi:hypothetical protein [Streptomyces sp. IBSBF 3136]|uniref:hypothetical protein n=1 Tax=Streptomyces sp. IBSBF 3136 TaxID=2903524 RepID=UPI002FDBEDA5
MTLVRRILRTPAHGTRARDVPRTTADAILGIPLPGRRDTGAPGLTDSEDASRLLADLARAGWPATTLAKRLDINPAPSPKSASNAPASTSTWPCGDAACTAT